MPDRSGDPLSDASTPVDRICASCLRSLPVSGVSVSVTTSGGHRVLLSASDPIAARLEELQSDLGEGPGLDALGQRQAVAVNDLADSTSGSWVTWPAFIDAALDTGARALFAFPLLLGAAGLGVLSMHCDRATTFDTEQQVRALTLADAMFYAVLDLLSASMPPGPDGSLDGSTDEVAPFLCSEVYQAAGMLMAQLEISIVEAMVRLRGHAFAHDRPVVDVARDVVARRLRIADDNHRGPTGNEESR